MGVWIRRLLLIVWWVSGTWLCLVAGSICYWFVKWFTDYDNPYRYEYMQGAGLVLVYSWPAALGVIAAGITPKTGMSRYKRVGGITLLALCIVTVLVFDYLQAKYR